MGIKGLTKFIADAAPNAIKEIKIENLMGRIIAIDASMSLYQFIIAIRDSEQYGNLTNESGETTSHISGLMSRSIKLMENGLKPIYVFDGAPPELKGSELEKRGEKRQKAEELLKKAKEEGNLEEIKKQSGRTVRVTKKQNEEAKRLLTLMGIPVIEAPCEAESQCAFLTKYDMAHATATEDADALVFGTKILIRNLNANASSSQNKNKNSSKRGYILTEINLDQVLKGLNLTMNEFIDFCILCGCDYCDTIKGIGSKTAYNLIKEYKCIEQIIENIDQNKYQVPSNFRYVEARESFINPKVLAKEEVKIDWNEPNIEELKTFLIKDYNFNEVRVTNYINRLLKARKVTTQRRLDNFFTACTKKSTKLIIEETQKELMPKRKGKKRDNTTGSNPTRLNRKQKTDTSGNYDKTVKKEVQQKGKIKKEGNEEKSSEKLKQNHHEADEAEEEEDLEINPRPNFFDEKTDSESGNIKSEHAEHNVRKSDRKDINCSEKDNDILNINTHLSSSVTLHSGSNHLCSDSNNLSTNRNNVNSVGPMNSSSNLVSNNLFDVNIVSVNSNNDKDATEIKKKNNLFLLPFCPKNVTKVKKRKSAQKC
ncbi:flap endonuclease 1 [Plasmodium brasilianum]|uniref:Flap endonuclease 1 n=2 Tax=Plasmodium (Plasmodium) TaxID=418103 RepID=A0A1A8VSY9_PLAMA|nr:flap endonuclease 1, putative [Plasmodium malariae]KAI4840668.1 flap endonuclease 1 [Plasmodium brasilianum]SBS81934.1 flap endonuclease 1, putative (FEN1) [Plasmodium malariae]SBT86233.1 flap endonuclease 1, putative [Plasmodium malariae]